MQQFNMFDKVKIRGTNLEGFIDVIRKDGKIRVKTLNSYEWVFTFEIKPIKNDEDTQQDIKPLIIKTDLRFFNG